MLRNLRPPACLPGGCRRMHNIWLNKASSRPSGSYLKVNITSTHSPVMYTRAAGFWRTSGLSGLGRMNPTPGLCRHQHRTLGSKSTQVKVLYDGLCPICVKEIRFLQFLQRKKPGKVDFIDISLPGYDGTRHSNISYEMAMEEMHVIDEKEQVHRGVPAFAVMYSAVGLGWLGRLMMCGPARPLMDKAYGVFARNRLKWTGRGEECSRGRCEKATRKE